MLYDPSISLEVNGHKNVSEYDNSTSCYKVVKASPQKVDQQFIQENSTHTNQ